MPTTHHSSDTQQPLTRDGIAGGESAASAQPGMAVFSIDLQGKFRGCNAAFTRLLDYSSQELVDRDLSRLFASTEKLNGATSSLSNAILSATSTQGDYHGRLFAHPKTGGTFPVQFSATSH